MRAGVYLGDSWGLGVECARLDLLARDWWLRVPIPK